METLTARAGNAITRLSIGQGLAMPERVALVEAHWRYVSGETSTEATREHNELVALTNICEQMTREGNRDYVSGIGERIAEIIESRCQDVAEEADNDYRYFLGEW